MAPDDPRRPPTTPDDPHRPLPTPARPGPRALRPGGRLLTRPPCLTELQELEGGGGPVRPPPHRPRPGLRQERAAHQPHRGLAAGGPRGGGAWRERDPITPSPGFALRAGRLPSPPGGVARPREHAPAVRAWPGGGFGRTPAQRRDTRGPRGTRASPAAATPMAHGQGGLQSRARAPCLGRLSQETLRPRLGPPCPAPPQAPDSESPPRSFSELQPRHPSEHRAALLALRLRLCVAPAAAWSAATARL